MPKEVFLKLMGDPTKVFVVWGGGVSKINKNIVLVKWEDVCKTAKVRSWVV